MLVDSKRVFRVNQDEPRVIAHQNSKAVVGASPWIGMAINHAVQPIERHPSIPFGRLLATQAHHAKQVEFAAFRIGEAPRRVKQAQGQANIAGG